ncbi:MAG: hypothetical protein ACRC0G_14040, partial [Fusobacteriaceae bacterium]
FIPHLTHIQNMLRSDFNALQEWLYSNNLLLNKGTSHTTSFGTKRMFKLICSIDFSSNPVKIIIIIKNVLLPYRHRLYKMAINPIFNSRAIFKFNGVLINEIKR